MPRAVQKYEQAFLEKQELERRLEKVHSELEKKLAEEGAKQNKENLSRNLEQRDSIDRLPLINPNELLSKQKKVNIHSYVAQRRRMASATDRKDSDMGVDLASYRKKLI
jgi:hypothetical protein